MDRFVSHYQPKVTASLSPTGGSRFGGAHQVQVPTRAPFNSVFPGKVLVRNDVGSVRIGQRKSGRIVVRMSWFGPRFDRKNEAFCNDPCVKKLLYVQLKKMQLNLEMLWMDFEKVELQIEKAELQIEEMRREGEDEAADAADAELRLMRQDLQQMRLMLQEAQEQLGRK